MNRKISHHDHQTPIAIIGLDCLFPKSLGLKAYWHLIYQGRDGITDIPPSHWSPEDYFDPDPRKADHTYCQRGGFLPPIDFDPTEFGLPPNTLEATDTSQLLALVTAKKALIDAGYGPDRKYDHSRTSVILGVTGTQELVIPLGARLGFPHWRRAMQHAGIETKQCEAIIEDISNAYVSWQESSFPGLLGNVVAGRICNRLDLGGTNCVVDAACASSMSALHLGLMELTCGRSDMVVSGGVDTLNDIFMHMCFSKTHILSPTGDIRPFSKNADGTVLGEGIGLLVLKRLDDAQQDGDRIYAVIKGLGSSSDGKSQSIYAPHAQGQARALRMAYGQAGIDPASVELLEAHGTGTRVGDRVEFDALQQVFNASSTPAPWCALGTVKSMIGHTKAAAGSAGLIKAALALHHKVLPPTLKAAEPDPDLNLIDSAFYLNTVSRPWSSNQKFPRRAGVSSFGFGGSNFHAILEEYQPRKSEIVWNDNIDIFALSADTHAHLKTQIQRLVSELTASQNVASSAHLMAHTRASFNAHDPYRVVGAVDHNAGPTAALTTATNTLKALESKKTDTRWRQENIFFGGPRTPAPLALVFPGQGSQFPGMGREFVCRFPAAFEMLERTGQGLDSSGRLVDLIYPRANETRADRKRSMQALTRTDVAQPAIGAISLGMFHVLQYFGVQPFATCGHSYGELAALCAAGWITVETFIHLSIERGACMAAAGPEQASDPGSMLAVKAPLEKIENLIQGLPVILANRNSPEQGVLSGPRAAIDKTQTLLRANGLTSIKLPVSAAFHSSMMAGAHDAFCQTVANATIAPTAVPVFSNTTAAPYPSDPIEAGRLLARQIIQPVNFVDEVENLFDAGVRTFIEVGPGDVLTRLIGETLQGRSVEALALGAKSPESPELFGLALTLSCLAAGGHPVALNKWSPIAHPGHKARMQIKLTGANYRQPSLGAHKGAAASRSDQPVTVSTGTNPNPTAQPTSPPKNAGSEKPAPLALSPSEAGIMNKHTPTHKFVPHAFAAIQEGLRAMQKLQQQTAEAHTKFLESQAQASRALEAMFASTRRLAEASPQLPSETTPPLKTDGDRGPDPGDEIPAECPSPAFSAATTPTCAPAVKAVSPALAAGNPTVATPAAPSASQKVQQHNSRDNGLLEEGLLQIVSDLTGYPMEMLGLDMDIEADLGIDSIKRVEILSTLEEQMPSLPSVTPEDMGALKTLGQIITYLNQDGPQSQVITNPSYGLEPPSQPVAAVSSSQAEPPPDDAIEQLLLRIVSDLTGYPMEMLGLDMDIEADLGIDSIKRVEILSTLEEQMPSLPSVTPEDMGTLKTLGQIIAYLNSSASDDPDGSTEVIPLAPASIPASRNLENEKSARQGAAHPFFPSAISVDRLVVTPQESALMRENFFQLPAGRQIYVLEDGSELSAAIVEALLALNIKATLTIPENLSSGAPLSDLGGLLIVAHKMFSDRKEWHPQDGDFLKQAFVLTQQVAPALQAAAEQGGALLATVTRLDGAFGFKTKFDTNPLMGGLAGLVKTAAIEWPQVACRAIDVASGWEDARTIAQAIAQEICFAHPGGPIEIGLDVDSRVNLATQPAPYPSDNDLETGLNPGDVVIVTGGGRGVTAAALQAVASHFQPTLILMGRSPAPSPEPDWLTGLKHSRAIKKAILTHVFDSKPPAPRKLQEIYRAHMANREIKATIASLQASGANVAYLSLDVRDADQVATALANIRQTYGPIKGLIHGAGTLADRLITAKTREQFNRVFDTKVAGLHALLAATRDDVLTQIVLFSSVAARTGNRGQVDYAMANEVLNKVAWHEARRRPDCKVTAINWGPWDGGMVSPSLKKAFERDQVPLIDLTEGGRCLVREMASGRPAPAEIVLGKMMPDTAIEPVLKQPAPLALSFKREIDLETVPVLGSHMLDGKPVVPLALMAEWFGHGALHENPGLMLHGFDDLRVLKGIRLDKKKKLVRMMAGKASKTGSAYEVPVELRDGIEAGHEVVHSHARAILSETLPAPPLFEEAIHANAQGYFRSVAEVYEKILFHGSYLRGIQEIISLSDRGMVARVASAPDPEQWITNPHRTQWIGDPLALDCAFQMASLWCYEETGSVSLPSYCASYRQYTRVFPSKGLTAVLVVTAHTARKLHADITWLDANDVVVAQIKGFEAVMDTSLIKAFKPQLVATG